MHRISRSWTWLPFIGLLLLSFLAIAPLLFYGLPQSFDAAVHFARIGVLDEHIRQGMLYPRWAPSMQLGHGYPVFTYYAPGVYYLVEVFLLVGASAYAALVLTYLIVLAVGSIGMFLWARDILGTRTIWPAWVAAVTYLFAPYLLVNIYIRGAVAEAAAQALLPWILWSFRRLLIHNQPEHSLLLFVLSLGGLAFVHSIVLLFAAPILLLYGGLLAWQMRVGRKRLVQAAVGLVLAMGISAFFWMPLIGERHYLSDTAYTIARYGWLPGNFWRWDTLLDLGWRYTYSFARPVRLGVVQIGLAVLGLAALRVRRAEVWGWAILAVGATLLAGAWAQPFWQSQELFTLVQFPWRLLTLISLALALLTGGIVDRLHGLGQGLATGLLLTLIVAAHLPRLSQMDVFSPRSLDISLPAVAQVELYKGVDTGGEGTSSVQEFKPRWVDTQLILQPPRPVISPASLAVHTANAFDLELSTTADQATTLRFSSFYFPGWQLTDQDGTAYRLYPDTNLGLLTVDLPPGSHRLRLHWQGTGLQRFGAVVSLAALLMLAWLCRRVSARSWLPALPLLLFVFGLTACLIRPSLEVVTPPVQPIKTAGLQLVGYRYAQNRDGYLDLFPYWFVSAPQPPARWIRWRLLDPMSGIPLIEVYTRPHYNSLDAANWPQGTLVDDAYQLPLPDDLPPGQYPLSVNLETLPVDSATPGLLVGTLTLRPVTGIAHKPSIVFTGTFEGGIELDGYELDVQGAIMQKRSAPIPVVKSGQTIDLALYWRADTPVTQNYHGFVHLTDIHGKPLAQRDQLPGPLFQPPLRWDILRPRLDVYRLTLPSSSPSGLYWPQVGLYDFGTHNRLSVRAGSEMTPTDHLRLPPIKVLNPASGTPVTRLDVRIGDFATLTGFSVTPAQLSIHAGSEVELILYYRADAPSATGYTRFVHLYSPEHGMAAQIDGPPANGSNPTDVWLRGELIADPIRLAIPPGVTPGIYQLYFGFYDPAADGARLSLTTQATDHPVVDNRVLLAQVTLLAP